MGPTTLFDKSFLQSLSVDESVLFDHYFIPAICPLFYVETLADLEKANRDGRTPEKEVSIIAQKTPEMEGTPLVHHGEIAIQNLMGQKVPMTGQIPVTGGKVVEVDGRGGVVFDLAPEAEAFARWQKQDFFEVERRFARDWRRSLESLNLAAIAAGMRAVGIDSKTCRTLKDAKHLADSVVDGDQRKFDRMQLAASVLGVPDHLKRALLHRWSAFNYPPLREYAPFAAHIVTVELFFQIALGARLISTEDANNRTDIGYLFYLPFCMMFVSSDRLHEKCAPLFMRDDQIFVWGQDLKADLARINSELLALPEEEREKGLFHIAPRPPKGGLVTQLWTRCFPKTEPVFDEREAPPEELEPEESDPEPSKNEQWTGADLKRFMDSRPLQDNEINFDVQDPSLLGTQHSIHVRKGSHWQLPKGTTQK